MIANTPKNAFDAYMKDLSIFHQLAFPKGFSSAERRRLIGEVKAGTIAIKLPSNKEIYVEGSRRHIEIWPVFPKFVSAVFRYEDMLRESKFLAPGFPVLDVYYSNSSRGYGMEELTDEEGVLNRKNPQALAKCVIQSRKKYTIESYHGSKKISVFFRTENAAIAKERFVLGNLPLVVWEAEKFRESRGDYLSLRKLVEIGNKFLLKNIDYFDPSKAEFATFFTKAVFKEFGLHLIKHFQERERKNVSYEGSFFYDDGEETAFESLERQKYKNPLEVLVESEREGAVRDALKNLDSRGEKVIRLQFWEDMSDVEIGERISKTRERARQVGMAAIRFLGKDKELVKIA